MEPRAFLIEVLADTRYYSVHGNN